MRNAWGHLPLFRTDTQADILHHLYLYEDLTVPELVTFTGATQPTIARELARLIDADLVTRRAIGNAHIYQANDAHPATTHLRALTPLIRGPLPQLRDALADLAGLHEAWVFGSWAARALGARGARPNDIDVLLVADATIDKGAVYEAAREAEAVTRHEVNVTFVTPERWAASDGGFITDVLAKPRLLVWQRPPA